MDIQQVENKYQEYPASGIPERDDAPPGSVHAPPPANLTGLSLDDPQTAVPPISQRHSDSQKGIFLRTIRRLDIVLTVLLVGGGILFFLLSGRAADNQDNSPSREYDSVTLPLDELISGKDLTLAGSSIVTINGSLQLNSSLALAPSLQPTGAKAGQIYYDQGTNQLAYFNGQQFVFLTPGQQGLQSLGGATGQLTLGNGLSIADNQLSNSGVLSVQGQSGAVAFTAGPGIVINGTNFSNSGVLTVNASTPNVTVGNDGAGNVTIGVVGAGTGTVSSPGGTAGTIPLFMAAQTIEDSIITQSGLNVTVAGNLNVSTNVDTAGTFASGTGNAFQIDLSGNVTSAGTASFQGGSLTIGAAAQTGLLLLYDGTSNTATIQTAPLGQNTVYTLPDPGAGSATICLSTGNCSGASVTLQGAYDNSTNPEIVVDSTRGALTIRDAAIAIGGNLLEVQSNDGATTYFGVTASGTNTAGTTSSTGNINSTTGSLQTGGNNRIDNSGNLVNIGNLTATAAVTIASTGAGNDIILNAADTIELQDNTNITGNADISGTLTAGTANAFQVAAGGDITTAGSAVLQGGVATIGTVSQAGTLTLYDGSSNTATLQIAALGQNTVYTLPDPGGASATICLTTGNCSGVGGGVTTGGGTTNRLAKFSGAQAIADSTISDDGTNVVTSVDMVIQGGQLTVGTASQTSSVILHDGDGQTTTVQAGNSSGNLTFILPTSAGNANQCLKQSGVGNQLVWQDCDGGSGGSSATLQTAYNNGNDITTGDARDIDIVLADMTTDSNFDLVIADGSTGYASFSRANGIGTTDPAQIILIDNLDANRPVPVGMKIQAAGGGITTAIDATDVEIDTALSVGANTILGTTGNIDYTNFDVDGTTGNVTAGTYNGQTISNAASFTGTVTVANNLTLTSGDIAVNGGDITSTGALNITPGGALVIGDTAQTAHLQGSVTTITSTGAGNDIVLNSADTIELQDSTNITGNLDVSGTLASGTLNAFQVAADGSITSTSGATLQGGTVTLGAVSQAGSLVLYDGGAGVAAHTGTIQVVGTLGQNTTYTLPDPGGASATICLSTGNCAGSGSGVTTAGGTTNRLAVFTGSQAIGDSWFLQNSSTLELDNTRNLSLLGGNLIVAGASTFRSSAATGLLIQNSAASETLLSVDTTARSASGGNLIKIGNSTGTDTALTLLQLDAATADPTSNLAALNGGLFYNATTHKVSLIEDGQVKIICNTTDLGCGTGTVTLQTAYANGNTITTTDGRDIEFDLTQQATDPNFLVDLQCTTGCSTNGRFAVQNSNTDVFTVSPASGGITIGSTALNTPVTINSGTGAINIATGNASNTIQIGNTANAVTQTINIGNNATASSVNNVTIGSLVGASTTTIQGGTGDINLTTNAATASVIVKSTTNNDEAFKVVNGSNTSLLTVKTNGTLGADMGTYVLGTGTGNGGSRLFFGDTNIYIGENGTTDTDVLALKASHFTVLNPSDTEIVSIDGTNGRLEVKAQSDQYGGFKVANSSGEQIFYVDPSSEAHGYASVFIGNDFLDSETALLVLDNAGFGATEPTPNDDRFMNGAMYYSIDRGTFRCFDGGDDEGTEAGGDIGGQWKECLGVPKPNTRRWTYITHPGGTGTTFNTQGDAVTATANASTGVIASTAEPSRVQYSTNTSLNDDAYIIGNSNYNSSNNPTYQSYVKLTSTTDVRVWAGLTGETAANMFGGAAPTANYAAFRYNTSTSDTDYKCVVGNSGGAPTVQGTGIGIDTNGHKLEVSLFSGKRVIFKIDGVIVCSIPVTTGDLPAANTMMNYINGVRTLTTAVKDIEVAWVYVETDK